MIRIDKYSKYSSALVRIALSLVFLWFGINQVFDSNSFLGYLPQFALKTVQMMHSSMTFIPQSAILLIQLNGIFEVIFGILLLAGLFTRIASLLLSAHLFIIMLSLSYNDVAVRDFGLMLCAFSIFLQGPDEWCIDRKKISWMARFRKLM